MAHPGHSNSSFVSPQNPASGSSSLAEAFRCQSKIADLTYRLRSLSNLPWAVAEIMQLIHSDNYHFIHYQKEIIKLVELARENLESAGVVLYLWASCPKHLLPHKSAYVDLLRVLQSNERYVDTELQKRVRVLLMPLTSTFTMSPDSDRRPSRESPPRGPGTWVPPHTDDSRDHATQCPSSPVRNSSSSMPPPDAFPVTSGQTHDLPPVHKSSEQRLWHSSELRGIPSERRRSRSPHPRSDASVERDQENVAPTPVAFYQPPTRQRFGIFLTGKSSMLGTHKRKDRAGRPTH